MADLENQDRGLGNVVVGEEEEKLLEGVTLVDFDMLCSTVAMQTQGKWAKLETTRDASMEPDLGGVFRMWEGELLDCFDDRRIAIESTWLDLLIHFFFSTFSFFRDFVFSLSLPLCCSLRNLSIELGFFSFFMLFFSS